MREYIHPSISGRPDSNWFTWSADRFITQRPVKRVLDLGCGVGGIERHGCALNLAAMFDAYDLSEGSIAEARRLADELGISDRVAYHVADFLEVDLPPFAYDVVYLDNALHHCFNVPGLLNRVLQVLKVGGLLILNEFVGPDRFQWTDGQLEAANEALNCLPERHRTLLSDQVRKSVDRPPIEQMIAVDPSEAVHSSQILPELSRRFVHLARRDWGGTILHPLLQDIIHNFQPDSSPDDASLLRLLMLYERTLIRSGQLPSDFVVLVVQKPE